MAQRVLCTVLDAGGEVVKETDLASGDVPGRVAATLSVVYRTDDFHDDGSVTRWERLGDGW